MQRGWTAHARGEAIHPCPLVTVPITTEDLAPWRATQDTICARVGDVFEPNAVTQYFPSFIYFTLITCKGPFLLLYCWNWGRSPLDKPESQIWKSSFREKKVKMKVTQSCPILCNPMDCSPWNSPGQNTGVGSLSLSIFPNQGSNPGLPHCRQILYQLHHQGSPRILEWIPYPFSNGSSQPRNQMQESSALQADSLPTGLSGKPQVVFYQGKERQKKGCL